MPLREVTFDAPEYQADGTFAVHHFKYQMQKDQSWKIYRDEKLNQSLPEGYRLIKSLRCGICSTDLARRFLPYPLPQILGHEVIGEWNGEKVAVDINASHKALGHQSRQCPYCENGLPTHCPVRLTLGINQLPGGFAPYFLAPAHGLHKAPSSWPVNNLTLIEPLAAAIHALKASRPQSSDKVAVVGPRKLGMLLIAALNDFRRRENLDFSIYAVLKHKHFSDLALAMGADKCELTQNIEHQHDLFDLVFDTSGAIQGFSNAMQWATREVHLKSTHGQPVGEMKNLTALVVDELSLAVYKGSNLNMHWHAEIPARKIKNVFLSSGLSANTRQQISSQHPTIHFHHLSTDEAFRKLNQSWHPQGSTFPAFDAAVVSSIKEADQIIRPDSSREYSIVRPRGFIFFHENSATHDIAVPFNYIFSGVQIKSSRCGSFTEAIQFIERNPSLQDIITEQIIQHEEKLEVIEEAFVKARDRKNIKVVVNTA